MTKGVKAYEALLFANGEYEDSASDFEEFVDDRLTSLASHSLLTAVEKIKFEKAAGNVEEFATDYADIDSDERADHVNIHLPTTLTEQLTLQRGLGDHIADAVYTLVESAYSDRMDRIQCKKELVEFLEDERRTLSHDVARAIVEGDSDEYRVDEAHRELNLVRSDDWYESDSVSISILEDRGEDITEGVANRSQALETALQNSDRDWDREEAIRKAKDVFHVHESTAQEYVDAIEISSMTDDVVEVDTTRIVSQIADEDWQSHEPSDNMYEYVGLKEEDMVVGEFTTEEAYELVDELSEKTMCPEAYNDTRQHAQDSLHSVVVALRKMLKNGYDENKNEHKGLKGIGAVEF